MQKHVLMLTTSAFVLACSSIAANAQQPPSAETINAAIHEFEEIIRIDPTERQSFLMLGRLYQIKGDRNHAMDIYEKFLKYIYLKTDSAEEEYRRLC
jgi:Tfp pilus assembly protein PilF